MTTHKQQYSGLWSKHTTSTLLRHIWRQKIIFVALIAMVLGLLCLLAWPLYWEAQHKGPTFQIKSQNQVINNHFGTLQLAVHDPFTVQFTSPGGQLFQACCLDYGDGKRDTVILAQKPTLTHAYEMAGTYVVSLLIWTDDMQEAPQKQLLGQLEVDCPGKLTVDYTAKIEKTEEGFLVQYESNITGAPENELTYLWKFGDGKISTKASPLYSYTTPGEYSVSLSVTRFLTTRYNCGDTAYRESSLILAHAEQTASGHQLISGDSGTPLPRQARTRMRGWFISVIGVLIALLGAGAYWAGKWFFVHKKQKNEEPKSLKAPGFLALPKARPQLFSAEKLFALARGLNHADTPDASHPSYLILIERQTQEDLFARLMEELWSSLQQAGVRLDFFFFQDNPRYCLDPKTNEYITLHSLSASHNEQHLILCTDGACLIDPYQKGLNSWVKELLTPWGERQYIFTPIPLDDWEEIESYLTKEFILCPASQPLVLPGSIQTGQYQPVEIARSSRISWKNGLSYSSTGLQQYLGEPLFRWLQMATLWPQHSSDWVLHLAQLFNPEDANFTYNSLIRLSRLSWMREGGLPPSLAYRWLANLPETSEREARNLLLQLLHTTLPPKGSVAEREKVRFIKLQQFFLHPEKRSYAKAIYPLLSHSNWNKTAQKLIHRKRKSLFGKSLGEYLNIRLGRLKTWLWSLLVGLGMASLSVFGLHAGWQMKSHQGGSKISLSEKQNPIWYTEIWEVTDEASLSLEDLHPEEQAVLETEELPMDEVTSFEASRPAKEPPILDEPVVEIPEEAPVEEVDESAVPCSERESPLAAVKGRGISGTLWIDKTVQKDFNRLKAYARDNGVELKILKGFPASQSGTDFGQKMAIGRAFVASLSYRKGLAWVPCEADCMTTSSGQPRPIRKFLEDLEKDPYWGMEIQPDDSSIQIWVNRYLPAAEAKGRAFDFAEYWEICGEGEGTMVR